MFDPTVVIKREAKLYTFCDEKEDPLVVEPRGLKTRKIYDDD